MRLENCRIGECSGLSQLGLNLDCFVISEKTNSTHFIPFDISIITIPFNLEVADTSFHRQSQIDILLWVDWFWSLVSLGHTAFGKDVPLFWKLIPFWSHCNFVMNNELSYSLSKFWNLIFLYRYQCLVKSWDGNHSSPKQQKVTPTEHW